MAYKTYEEKEIKAKGYDLMHQTLNSAFSDNTKVAICVGIGRAIDNILEDFKEKENAV